MAFWIKRVQGTPFLISDLGQIVDATSEMNLEEFVPLTAILASISLPAAFTANDLERITGPGGVTVPPGTEFDNIAPSHDMDSPDHTGGTHGDVLFRGASGWERLSAGAAGQALRSQGAAADPTWTDIFAPNPPSTDHALTRWDGVNGDKVQDTGIIVDDNDKTVFPGSGSFPALFTIDPTTNQWASRGAPEPGYVATIRGSATESGLFVKACDDPGTYPIHIEDNNATIQHLHMEHAGELGLGTVTPVYGIDLSRGSGNLGQINTASGLYRIGGERANDAISAYDRDGSQTFTGSIVLNLDSTNVNGNLYRLISDIITVGADGRYLISYGFTTRLVSGGISGVEGNLQSAPTFFFSNVPGTLTRAMAYVANIGASASVVKDVVAGERFRVLLNRVYGSGTCGLIAEGSFLNIVRLS